MLVDNALPHPFADLSDIFHSDLFSPSLSSSSIPQSTPSTGNNSNSTHNNPTSSTSASPPSSSSRASSPSSPYTGLLTPPQGPLPTTFPEIQDGSQDAFMSIFTDEDLQAAKSSSPSTSTSTSSSNPYDFMGMNMGFTDMPGMGINMGINGMSLMPMEGYGMDPMMMMGDMSLSSIDMMMPMMLTQPEPVMGIDPQLVGSPTDSSPSEAKENEQEGEKEDQEEKLTLTIAPVKVGGHGKNRRGTVQSGGVVKKAAQPPLITKELSPPPPPPPAAVISKPPASTSPTSPTAAKAKPAQKPKKAAVPASVAGTPGPDDDDDDDHELPQDWRPPPEVFAKMTSKEKRQLRNKISARNFRVRRKEYISTLEGDIAERDRVLDAIRTELGSTKDENRALRQEIEALKRTLLDGRGAGINLPPPAPLPDTSAAASLAAAPSSTTTSTSTQNIIAPNTQKDLPTSPRLRGTGSAFWGGAMGGIGITPVHATFVPEVALGRKENINPAMNANANGNTNGNGKNENVSVTAAVGKLGGFDGFADLNPFTMKTLDAYRMHLWGKMAQQQQQHSAHQHHQQQHQQHQQNAYHHPTGLASSLKPMYFSSSSPSSSSSSPSSTGKIPPVGYGSTLSALLSGKQAYPSPPTSPKMGGKVPLSFNSNKEKEREREQQQQAAIIAAMASQTLLKKLGSAFWDAFSGSSSSPLPASSSSLSQKNWDAEKVRKVLEGKAVVRVVDVEPVPSLPSPPPPVQVPSTMRAGGASVGRREGEKEKKCGSSLVCDILEESMRSLTLGKKM
ncbi:hypothetical protein BDQ17DRAFT_488388 [Cyathus striatus]|nr:hypothetical protein BDQ17DRAFT_488388 [Cyathus striatus]